MSTVRPEMLLGSLFCVDVQLLTLMSRSKRFHVDNHPFDSHEFHPDLELQNQSITFIYYSTGRDFHNMMLLIWPPGTSFFSLVRWTWSQSKCEEAALTNRREESVGQPITTFTVLYTCQCTEFRRKSNESMASADQEFQGKSIYFYPWFDCNT